MTTEIHDEIFVYQTQIPQGQTKEEMQIRKKIIKDFYAIWNAANPTKHIYNTNSNRKRLKTLYIQEIVISRFALVGENTAIFQSTSD